jgi:hypothetical protein
MSDETIRKALEFYRAHHHHLNTTAPNFAAEALEAWNRRTAPVGVEVQTEIPWAPKPKFLEPHVQAYIDYIEDVAMVMTNRELTFAEREKIAHEYNAMCGKQPDPDFTLLVEQAFIDHKAPHDYELIRTIARRVEALRTQPQPKANLCPSCGGDWEDDKSGLCDHEFHCHHNKPQTKAVSVEEILPCPNGSVIVSGVSYTPWIKNAWRGTPKQAAEDYEQWAEVVPACAYDAAISDRNALIYRLNTLLTARTEGK